jgi:transmembrane sensor
MAMKSGSRPVPSHEEIEGRAADFLQRRRFGNWNETDQAELDRWLNEAHQHLAAFLRLETGLARIERLTALRPPKRAHRVRVAHLRVLIPYLASAVSLGLIAILGLAVEHYLQPPPPPDRNYSTDVGGRALLSFADRTQIQLNTDTAVRFRMTTAERTVWLDRGEAWFRVTHDAANPFTVIVGNHRITDLGTEFLVRSDPGRFEVALLKGRAQLSTGGDRPQIATLASGDEAVATPASTFFTRKTPRELADELAWQRGVLRFQNTKLADAVKELNRYNRVKLVIDDPAVAGMPIGGDFRTDSIDAFLQAVQVVLKLRVVRGGDTILLSRVAGETKGAARENRSL